MKVRKKNKDRTSCKGSCCIICTSEGVKTELSAIAHLTGTDRGLLCEAHACSPGTQGPDEEHRPGTNPASGRCVSVACVPLPDGRSGRTCTERRWGGAEELAEAVAGKSQHLGRWRGRDRRGQ